MKKMPFTNGITSQWIFYYRHGEEPLSKPPKVSLFLPGVITLAINDFSVVVLDIKRSVDDQRPGLAYDVPKTSWVYRKRYTPNATWGGI